MLNARVRERSALAAADVAAMYALFALYYEGGSRAIFERDLAGKSHVVELYEDAELRGFSTLSVFAIHHAGERVRGIFSGDTIIDHAYWGEQALARAFCEFAGRVHAEAIDEPLYWLLISKGHRTYRFLHVFARTYFPSCGAPTPPAMAALLDAFCAERFGTAYDAAAGIVRPEQASTTRLRPEWQAVRETLRAAPQVAFFLARNPGHGHGDELACVCRLEPANLRSFALSAFRRGMAA